ncbi:hypothetical protein SASPL_149688 [Salvia splendens]|uniref:Iron-binding zinc finger CDGSH type domain-containing protein n=1 Tax=Salvia splendens TaxID=180675 RepID=A0A8X8WCP7_SALSN|nr:hypothetical protein SASPL_149688 [Salvia splendens]
MASLFSTTYASLSYGGRGPAASKPPRRMVAVRAEAINPDIRKTEEKVVDSVLLPEISKPVTAYCRFHSFHPNHIYLYIYSFHLINYSSFFSFHTVYCTWCRCWRSGTFPLCDGSHLKHNKATGDNVGPLLLKLK